MLSYDAIIVCICAILQITWCQSCNWCSRVFSIKVKLAGFLIISAPAWWAERGPQRWAFSRAADSLATDYCFGGVVHEAANYCDVVAGKADGVVKKIHRSCTVSWSCPAGSDCTYKNIGSADFWTLQQSFDKWLHWKCSQYLASCFRQGDIWCIRLGQHTTG